MDSKNDESDKVSIKEAQHGVLPSSNNKFVHTKEGEIFFGSADLYDHYQLLTGGQANPELRKKILSQKFVNAGLIIMLSSEDDQIPKFAIFGSSGDLQAINGKAFATMPDTDKLDLDGETIKLLNQIYQGKAIFVSRRDLA